MNEVRANAPAPPNLAASIALGFAALRPASTLALVGLLALLRAALGHLSTSLFWPTPWFNILVLTGLGTIVRPVLDALALGSARALRNGSHASSVELLVGAARAWPRMFAASLMAALLVSVGLVALVIPGLVLMVRTSLMPAAVFLWDDGALAARRTSRDRTRGGFGFAAALVAASIFPGAATFPFRNVAAGLPIEIDLAISITAAALCEIVSVAGTVALAFRFQMFEVPPPELELETARNEIP